MDDRESLQYDGESSSRFMRGLNFFLKAVLFFSLLIIVSFFLGFGAHALLDVMSRLFN